MTDKEIFTNVFAKYCTIGCYDYISEIRKAVLAAIQIGRERGREANAKLCESMMYDHGPFGGEIIYSECAAAIRERGKG